MGQPVAALPQPHEEGRQHCRCLRLHIMEEQDSAPRPLQPAHHQRQLRGRAHRRPVTRPEIAPEHANAARRKPLVERLSVGKAGIAEERRARPA